MNENITDVVSGASRSLAKPVARMSSLLLCSKKMGVAKLGFFLYLK